MSSKKRKITSTNEHSNIGILLAERENKIVAGELHDNLSSKLSIIRFKLCNKPNEDYELISLLDTIIVSVRKMSHRLYSPTIEYCSFIDAVRDFIEPLHDTIKIELQCDKNVTYALSKKSKFNLFRIFQELINNILKHANASYIFIRIKFEEKHLTLYVKDNGLGFSNSNALSNGLGIKNIIYRAEQLKAKHKFFSVKNKGTLFIIQVPIQSINIKL